MVTSMAITLALNATDYYALGTAEVLQQRACQSNTTIGFNRDNEARLILIMAGTCARHVPDHEFAPNAVILCT